MVRILTCHHFQAQRTGRTEEPVGVAVVEDSVIVVGLEHQINVYYLSDIAGGVAPNGPKEFSIDAWLSKKRKSDFGEGEFGSYFTFAKRPTSATVQMPTKTLGPDGELRLSHSFAPVGVLRFLDYNSRGHYLICLESQEALTSVRVYFKWDKNFKGKTMTARIAGLVSPTGNRETEENSLSLIEIPAMPSFSPKAVATCQLTGNICSLSTDLRISIYTYKEKEGRSKISYGDFDLICTVQLFGITPDKICLVSNHVACMEGSKAYVLRIFRTESDLPKMISPPSGGLELKSMNSSNTLKLNGYPDLGQNEGLDGSEKCTEKVVFNRKDNSVKVYLNTITRANRMTKQPNSFISEEFQEDITVNKSAIIFSSSQAPDGYSTEDLLRIHVNKSIDSGDNLLKMHLQPVRVKDKLGGVSFVIATSKEAFSYHLPLRKDSFVIRDAIYSFTSTLISCTYDSLFFHALTVSGVETFTTRNLYNAVKDTEGFETFVNDCPLSDESPVLIGMKPFIGGRLITCNESTVCVLTCPPPPGSAPVSAQQSEGKNSSSEVQRGENDELQFTLYILRCPTWELLEKDIMKEALVHQASNPDAYFVLICELHLILRTTMLKHPNLEPTVKDSFKKVSKLIGFEYFRKSTRESLDESKSIDLIEKGITYLKLASCDVHYLFSTGNTSLLKDPQLILGIVRFIDVSLPRALDDSSDTFSPTLSRQILEFLALNSIKTMVSIVIDAAWLRECNAKRLLEILNDLVASEQYDEPVCTALILSIIAVNGSDKRARVLVKEVLDKLSQKHLKPNLNWTVLLERKKNQLCLSDVLICLSSANSDIHTDMLSAAVKNNDVNLIDVLLAFSHGVNLCADTEVQKNLGRDLLIILENHFLEKLNDKSRTLLSPTISQDDEIRALHALVRSYLTHIATNPHAARPVVVQFSQSNPATEVSQSKTVSKLNILADKKLSVEAAAGGAPKLNPNWLQFGKLPEFINCIIPDLDVDSNSGTSTENSSFPTLESQEYFVKLASLLGSIYGHTPGLEELISTTLNQKGQQDAPVHICLRLLSASPESAISTLMSSYPTVLMLYAKEMFGKSTKKWKVLVTKLKDKIKSNPDDVDMFTTIIESVYLHLANTLSPIELEHVLDKKEENAKFHAACRRIDLANTFTSKIVTMAEAYLNDTAK